VSAPDPVLFRLAYQVDAIFRIVRRAKPEAFDHRPESAPAAPAGRWTAREHLAHLARYHAVFHERLERILHEESPSFGRYRAEDDPQWPAWQSLPLGEVLERLSTLRKQLTAKVLDLPEPALYRIGLHPTFGALDVHGWIELFLAHEGHHLYIMMLRLGES
jgi:hypothetical protein